ncbi:MAG: hypothetical protein HYX72_06220 [Acidobacteria bacterium]|nr:hypothetical protein [Acidobacteriota bacterium]
MDHDASECGKLYAGLGRGGIASLFDSGITSVQGVVTASEFPLPTELDGTFATVFGTSAPIFSVSNIGDQQQINFQIPHKITDNSGTLIVNNNGVKKTYFPVIGGGAPQSSFKMGSLLFSTTTLGSSYRPLIQPAAAKSCPSGRQD